MNASEAGGSPGVQGQMLRFSARREVVIYLREDALWIADFIDGHGELVDPITWFRFNCGGLSTSRARLRMVRESAMPLSAELVARIERLHLPTLSPDTDHRNGSVSGKTGP